MSQQQLQNKIHFLSQAPFSFLFDVHVSQLPIKIRYGYLKENISLGKILFVPT